MGTATAMALPQITPAAVFDVDTANDTHAANPVASPLDNSGHVSLRSAIEAANTQTGEMTINLPAGIYNLTLGELSLAPNGTKTLTIAGAGSATTTVSQTDGANRVFNIDINSAGGANVTLAGITISGGQDKADQLGGAGILAGSLTSTPLDNLVLKDCQVRDNRCSPPNASYTGQPGGGLQMAGGNLSVISCTFSNNSSAASPGGGLAFVAPNLVAGGSGGSLTVTDSLFANNSVTNSSGSGPSGGGAIFVNSTVPANHTITGSTFTGNVAAANSGATFGGAIYLNTGTLNLKGSTLAGNRAQGEGAQGGAIYVDSGTNLVSFCRIVGNVAISGGDGVYVHASNGGYATAQENWWGCNAGPGNAGCNAAASDGTSVAFAPWLVFTNTAAPGPILVGQSATLTASFLQDSSANAVNASDLGAFVGVPVTFDNPVLGALSAIQTMIQPNGTATALFTAGTTAGAGAADASVDNARVTATVTILNQPPVVTNSPVNQAVCLGSDCTFTAAASGVPAPTVQWQQSSDGGGTWTDIPSAISSTLTVTSVTAAQDGDQYRAVFTSTAGTATSAAASLTVFPLPVAVPDALGTIENQMLSVSATNLLANDTSPIPVLLALFSVSNPTSAGGSALTDGKSVTYNPPAGFVGTDSFTYLMSDGRCTAVGTVKVTVISSGTPGLNSVSLTITPGGRVLRFQGVPTQTYVVQWAAALDGTWNDFPDGTLVADATGLITYTDTTSPLPSMRFYRVRLGP